MDKADQTVKNWRNQATGKAFQLVIEQLASYTPGVLLVPQWPQVQFFKDGKAKIVGEAWPDYVLYYYRLPFLFDAKTTVEPTTYRPGSKSKHQFEHLRLAASNGLGAFYLVNWLSHRMIELFPVIETDLWPVSYKYLSGVYQVEAEGGNWLGEMTEHFFRHYYK